MSLILSLSLNLLPEIHSFSNIDIINTDRYK